MKPNQTLEEKCAEKLFETIPLVMQEIRRKMRAGARHQLTVPQFRTLHRLSKKVATNGELAEWVGISLPAMSKMVDVLVKRGLICREQGSVDRRQVQLSLTEKGVQINHEARATARKMFAQRLKETPRAQIEALMEAFKNLQRILIDSEEKNHETAFAHNNDARRNGDGRLRSARTVGSKG